MPPLWNFGTTPLVTVAFPWDDPKSTDVISVCKGRGRNKKGLPPKGMGRGMVGLALFEHLSNCRLLIGRRVF